MFMLMSIQAFCFVFRLGISVFLSVVSARFRLVWRSACGLIMHAQNDTRLFIFIVYLAREDKRYKMMYLKMYLKTRYDKSYEKV